MVHNELKPQEKEVRTLEASTARLLYLCTDGIHLDYCAPSDGHCYSIDTRHAAIWCPARDANGTDWNWYSHGNPIAGAALRSGWRALQTVSDVMVLSCTTLAIVARVCNQSLLAVGSNVLGRTSFNTGNTQSSELKYGQLG